MPDVGVLGMAAAIAVALYFVRSRLKKKQPVEQLHLRGRTLRRVPEVRVILDQERHASDPGLLIGCQLFPSDIATRHFAFVGTTGSGKTLLQRLLMQSALAPIRQGHGHRAVVYDAKQDILGILSGMRVAVAIRILNPLDARSVAWNMAGDVLSPAGALQVATTLVPAAKNDANPFFTNAARQLLYGVLLALVQLAPARWSLRQVLLLLRDTARLQALLSRTESTQHLNQYFAHPATAQNIFSTVLTFTSPFEIIAACWDRAAESLSLSDWLSTESILVLGNDEQNRAALDTINKLLFQRLTELVLAEPELNDREPNARRTWFFLDEVREAGKLELLGRLLTKGRSKGVAVALGFQDISGLREAYGRNLADEILGQCNTKAILRLNSPETAAWAAKLFGNREVLESRRSQSRNQRVSLNREVSAGDSVSHAVTQQPVVLDSELLDLPEINRENGLQAYFINPRTGPFKGHIDSAWFSNHLLPADATMKNFIPRPAAHQFLRPWDAEDDALFELDDPEYARGGSSCQ